MSTITYVGNISNLANKLQKGGIRVILNILCNAYQDLITSNLPLTTYNEVKINEAFYTKILIQFRQNSSSFKINTINLLPLSSKPVGAINPSKGKFPEIDICFRDEIDSESFFGVECKIIDDNVKKFYTLYISQGVKRYLTGIYIGKCSHSAMVGYVKNGNMITITNEIGKRVKKLHPKQDMLLSSSINTFNDHYESIHKLSFYADDFHLHHMFFKI